jgi:hypothetical protein
MDQILSNSDVEDASKFVTQHPGFLAYIRQGIEMKNVEDKENCCMITLPCRNAGKKLMVLIAEV